MPTTPSLGFEVEIPLSLDAAIDRLADALKGETFGVLTRIDVHTAMREKLDVTFRPYAILGVCNPALAYRALTHDPQAGLLLPCNVTVDQLAAGRSLVRIGDPRIMLAIGGVDQDATLRAVAEEAREKLLRVAAALAAV